MTIPVKCQCGRQFKAKPQLAGKTVKCPVCGNGLTVPHPAPEPAHSAQSIEVKCGCGKRLKAKSELAGRRVKCPACQRPLEIPLVAQVAPQAPLSPAPAAQAHIADSAPFDPLADPLAGDPLAGDPLAANPLADPLTARVLAAPAKPAAQSDSGTSKKLYIVIAAAAGGVLLVVLLLVVLLSGNGGSRSSVAAPSGASGNRVTSASTSGRQPVAVPINQPTDEQCETFGREFEAAVARRDVAAMQALFDVDGLISYSSSDIKMPARVRGGLARNFKQLMNGPQGPMRVLLTALGSGGTYKYLRTRTVDGEKRVLFRLSLQQGGFNYLEYLLNSRIDGRVVAYDVYTYATGELQSDSVRRMYLVNVAEATKSRLEQLVSGKSDMAKYDAEVQQLVGAARTNANPQRVIEIYRKLPKSVQDEKVIKVLYVTAATRVSEQECAAAMADFKRVFPDDPALNILSIDYHALRKEFDKSIEALMKLDQAVGGDPMLYSIAAAMEMQRNDLAAARRRLDDGLALDPDSAELHVVRAMVAVAERNFADAAESLRVLRDKHNRTPPPNLRLLPQYGEFLRSAEYQQFQQGS